jgi:succinate dehydrogenase/fumarate reductase flavoprotein subunit
VDTAETTVTDLTAVPELTTDILVIGGGIAGLTLAATVAARGRSVVICEASEGLGGAGAISQGYLWVPEDESAFLRQDPDGSVEHFRAMRADLEVAFDALEEWRIWMGPLLEGMLGYGVGRQFDVQAYIDRCAAVIESSGGWILRGARAAALLMHEDGAVQGAVVHRHESEETVRIGADTVVLATGGFQGSGEWRDRLLPHANNILLRSTPHGRGDGLTLAESAGADIIAAGGFYGHLVPSPLEKFRPEEFAPLALFESVYGVLLDASGTRFCDESIADHLSNQDLVDHGGRGVLVMDAQVRARAMGTTFIPGMAPFDKFELAIKRGAHFAEVHDLHELAAVLDLWGFDGRAAVVSIAEFNAAMASGEPTTPPRRAHRDPVVVFPLTVLEVQPAMTFTFPGIRTDLTGHVLDPEGRPVRNLYAVGSDVGGINARGYSGGLARAMIFGRRAADAILEA